MLVATKLDDSIVLTPVVRVLILSGVHPASCCAFRFIHPRRGHCRSPHHKLGQVQTLTATLPLSQASLPVCFRCCSSGWAPAACGRDLLWKTYSPATMRSALLRSVLHLW